MTADVILADPNGNPLAQYQGVTLRRLSMATQENERSDPMNWLYQMDFIDSSEDITPLSTDDPVGLDTTCVLLVDAPEFGDDLTRDLLTQNADVVVVSPADQYQRTANVDFDGNSITRFTVDPLNDDHFQQLIADLGIDPGKKLKVIHAWSVNVPNPTDDGDDAFSESLRLSVASTLSLYRPLSSISFSVAPDFLLLTQGGQITGDTMTSDGQPVSFLQQEMIGMGRVAMLEYAGLNTRLIDLDPTETTCSQVSMIASELFSSSDETQVVYRNGKRQVGRIRRLETSSEESNDQSVLENGNPFRLTIGRDNTIDSLRYKAFDRTSPGPGQIEIKVIATGLNFSDVLKSLGLYPGITDDVVPVGIECAGIVSAVGEGVQSLSVGDEVMGVVPHGFASHCLTSELAVVKKSDLLDFEEAATIPIAFMTAYHCLVRVARLQPGERVLIHAGAGGVGLAAIQIAAAIGAEIFTTAGSDVKRGYLESIGVQHVMNSRTVDFADQIMQITGGKGVDVVLNSLPADAIDHSLAVLGEYGRFVEIGKVDIYQNKMIGLLPFQRNLSYTAVDLDRMFRQRPEEANTILVALAEKFDDGTYQPLNLTVFEAIKITDAFRYMSQRRNIGKVIVTMQSEDAELEEATDNGEALPEETEAFQFRDTDATYLVTGGLGALGRMTADWLANQGARTIVLMSRRAPSEKVQEELGFIEQEFSGSNLVVVQGDVSDRESLDRALDQIRATLPPLRGIIHAAGVVEQRFMIESKVEHHEATTAAKIRGGWNLHRATLSDPLECFAMFSSVSTIVGTMQQSAYGAANAFLDGLSAERQRLGLPTTAINWGPWAEVGMAAESGSDLASRGMLSLPATASLDLMGHLIRAGTSQATVMIADWPKLIRAYDAIRRSGVAPPLFDEFKVAGNNDQQAEAEAKVLHAKLMTMATTQREESLRDYLAAQVAGIMGLETEDLDINQSLNTMGLDSLMAIELANKLQLTLQVALPMALFIENPSVASLAAHSAKAMEGTVSDQPKKTPVDEAKQPQVAEQA